MQDKTNNKIHSRQNHKTTDDIMPLPVHFGPLSTSSQKHVFQHQSCTMVNPHEVTMIKWQLGFAIQWLVK